MEQRTHVKRVDYYTLDELAFLTKLGKGKFCLPGVIKDNRLSLLYKYKRSLSERTFGPQVNVTLIERAVEAHIKDELDGRT